MKRFVFYAFSFLFIILTAAYIEGAPTLVQDSKHNLSSDPANANTIKSSTVNGTSEICVFCHTPHSARADAPLWNRTNITGTRDTYWSDVLAGLSYPAPEDPSNTGLANYAIHVKTRICLSCHDGTIALGSLVNLPSTATSGEIQMVGTAGSLVPNGMPASAAGYLGTDFRDDHPVAVKYLPSGTGPDPEIKGSASRPAELKVYASGGFDYIECTTCHNAHDNQYGNFLVMTNDNSALCKGCHDKTGYDPSSVHSVATQSYSPSNGTPAGTLGTTVGNVDCMGCHFPHKSGIADIAKLPKADENPAFGAYLLSFQEEQSCYNSPDRWNNSTAPCHGDNGQAVKNIKGLVDVSKTSRHQVDMNGSSVLHEATEARGIASGWLGGGNAKWHIECADCHNPHTAGSATRTQINPNNPIVPPVPTTTLLSTSPLYGTGGVRVDTWPNNWNTPNAGGTYTYLEPIGVVDTLKNATGARYEYQICLKCHSNFAWPVTPPNARSLSAPMTNQSLEFNPANIYANGASAHPVAGATGHTDGTLSGNWNNVGNKGNQTMYCSDCHNNNLAPPQGPHGSNNQAILYRPYTNIYGPTNGGQVQEQPSGDICLGCHPQAVYLLAAPTQNVPAGGSTGFASTTNINLHAQHQWRAAGNSIIANLRSYRCVNCHTRVSHGWKRKALIVFRGDGVPFGTNAHAYEAGGANSALIDNTSTLNASGNYSFTKGIDCTTANAIGCHQ